MEDKKRKTGEEEKEKQVKKKRRREAKIEIRDLSSLSVFKSDGFYEYIPAPNRIRSYGIGCPKREGQTNP